MLSIGSTEFLGLLAKQDCYIMFEKGVPYSNLKRDFISIRESGGRYVTVLHEGKAYSPIELPREIFDDFCRASLIRQDGGEDEKHRLIFRLTSEGIKRGLEN